MIDPFPPIQSPWTEFFYQHSCREGSVLKANIILFTAFKASAYIIGWIPKDDDGVVSESRRFLEGIFHQFFSVALSLIFRQDADRPKGKDTLFVPVFIDEFCFGIHHIANDLLV